MVKDVLSDQISVAQAILVQNFSYVTKAAGRIKTEQKAQITHAKSKKDTAWMSTLISIFGFFFMHTHISKVAWEKENHQEMTLKCPPLFKMNTGVLVKIGECRKHNHMSLAERLHMNQWFSDLL